MYAPHANRSLKKRISHILEYLFVQSLTLIIYPIPFRSLDTVAGVLSRLGLLLLPSARKRITANLAFTMPELQGAELEQFVRDNFRNTVRVSLEVFQTRKFKNQKFLDHYLRPANDQVIPILQNRENGIVVIQGHFGNWELPILFYARHDVTVPFSLKHQNNPHVDRLLERRRNSYGGVAVYMEESDKLLKFLKKKYVIGLVADQDAGPGGVFSNFFGRQASTFPGPSLLAYITGTEIMLLTCLFQGRGRYEIDIVKVHPKVNRKEFGSRDQAVQDLTGIWVGALEKEVRKQPDQYFWVHRRWKSRPPEETADD
jgi:KDO2-lipid IV(A) lauroyltransferase